MTRLYPYLGIASVILSYVFIAVAIFLSPWFSWYNNALSDLGNSSLQKNIASGADLVFNTGLIVGGVLASAFAILLSREFKFSWKYLIWSVSLLVGSTDLALIGIFNESFGVVHLVVSVIFFFFTAITLFLYSYVSFPIGAPATGAVALVLGIVCALVWIVRWPWTGVAIQETVSSAASGAFVILVALRAIGMPKVTSP